jgi:hypothetical protein
MPFGRARAAAAEAEATPLTPAWLTCVLLSSVKGKEIEVHKGHFERQYGIARNSTFFTPADPGLPSLLPTQVRKRQRGIPKPPHRQTPLRMQQQEPPEVVNVHGIIQKTRLPYVKQ